MNLKSLCLGGTFLALLVAMEPAVRADAAPAATPAPTLITETPAQHAARMAWWQAAKFGLFIHWGVYSVPAGFYHGQPVRSAGEWIMNGAHIPKAEYQQFAPQFNPVKFDADAWVSMAKAAGMKYIVITAKHHDGFAMFRTQASPWNIVEATPFKRDPLQELAAACRKQGIKLGFYYSQAQDWNNGGACMQKEGDKRVDKKWDPAQERDMDDYIDKVAIPQVRELLTNYGPDVPAVLWWDTPLSMTPARAERIAAVVRELRPDLITNNRLGGGIRGDTETPEQFIPARGYPGRDWESCMTINGTWGYKSNDLNFKPAEALLRNLVDIVSKGGNYLLNVGPDAQGLIPPPEVERLQAVGAWLHVNGEAIYGTSASPFSRLPWGRAAEKIEGERVTLFLHVFDWPTDGKLVVPGLKSMPSTISLLASGAKLSAIAQNGDLLITVPAVAPDPVASVLKLEFTAPPEIDRRVPTQQADGSLLLGASDADVNNALGTHSAVEKIAGTSTITKWADDRVTVSWICQVNRPGAYAIEADYQATKAATAGVKINGKSAGTLAFSATPLSTPIGQVQVDHPGEIELKIEPQKPWSDVTLRSIHLWPATAR